jgi:hypothetical protein
LSAVVPVAALASYDKLLSSFQMQKQTEKVVFQCFPSVDMPEGERMAEKVQ